jgi:MoaA/NifB/PqqE/SkfB family radical SAM enzyme
VRLTVSSPHTHFFTAVVDICQLAIDGIRVKKGYHPKAVNETDLYFTRSCNLMCSYCYVEASFPDSSKQKTVGSQRFKQILSKIRKHSRGLVVLGGEPFCREDIDEILRFAKVDLRFLSIRISTNGMFLSQHRESL